VLRPTGQPFLDKARRVLTTATGLVATDPESAYVLAYDAARHAATALLAHQGLRTTSKGGHYAVDLALRAQFGAGFRSFSALRRRRNELEYPEVGAAVEDSHLRVRSLRLRHLGRRRDDSVVARDEVPGRDRLPGGKPRRGLQRVGRGNGLRGPQSECLCLRHVAREVVQENVLLQDEVLRTGRCARDLFEQFGRGRSVDHRCLPAELGGGLSDCRCEGIDVDQSDDVVHLRGGVGDDRAAVGVSDQEHGALDRPHEVRDGLGVGRQVLHRVVSSPDVTAAIRG
jgi:hypothetical protein